MIRNVHDRTIQAAMSEAEAALAALGTDADPVWPLGRWPAMRFKEGLKVGARGGHGPIRYRVVQVDPARVAFEFEGPQGFRGGHWFELHPHPAGGIVLLHGLRMEAHGLAMFSWPLVFRWLHDACVEDALDNVQAHLEGRPWTRRSFGMWVRFLRFLFRRRPGVHRSEQD